MSHFLLRDIIEESFSGFASGDNVTDGTLQVRMNNIDREGSWDWSKTRRVPASARQLDRGSLRPNDIVVNTTNSPELVGRAAVFPGALEPVVVSNHFNVMRLKERLAFGPYVARWLHYRWQQGEMRKISNQWVNQAAIGADALLSVPVLLPGLEHQHRIATQLDLADGIRRKRREALRLADELVRSTFLEMFGDPVGNPRGWEIGRLGDLAKFKSGSFLPASAMAPDGTFAVYGGNGVNGRHDEFLFPDPMIVVGRVGAYCGAVHRTEPCSWVTDNALFAEWIAPVLREDYFEWFLRFFNLNKLADRAGQPLISNGRLAPVLVPLPPVHVQEAFGRRLQSMELAIGKLNLALQKAETLFTSLQNQAFGGDA